MGALGLLALFIRVNFSLICNTPRDGVFPDRVKIKITISHFQHYRREAAHVPALSSDALQKKYCDQPSIFFNYHAG